MNKFNIGEGLSDAVQHLINGWKKYLLSYIMLVVISLVSGIVISVMVVSKLASASYDSLEFLSEAWGIIILLGLMIGYFSMVMQATIIKVTDDLIEHRNHTFGEQLVFAIRKSGKIILANLLALIPMLILFGIMFASLFSMGSGGLGLYFICLIGILVYTVFIAFITQSIITEDVTSIEAIGKSFAIAKSNFFRYSFTMILLGIVTMIIQRLFSDTSTLAITLSTIVSSVLSVYVIAFVTSLYKQVTININSEPELEYFEDLDI